MRYCIKQLNITLTHELYYMVTVGERSKLQALNNELKRVCVKNSGLRNKDEW